jgi:hypothetical protein
MEAPTAFSSSFSQYVQELLSKKNYFGKFIKLEADFLGFILSIMKLRVFDKSVGGVVY